MSREKEDYRDNVERIIARFPAKELIPITEVARWLGQDPKRLRAVNGVPIKKVAGRHYITVVALAKWLSTT